MPNHDRKVAYFSAEYAIADDMPIYAGGLGVLAADMVMEAAAQNRSFYAVGLVYHLAFTGDDADQRPMTERLEANGFSLATVANGERLKVYVPIANRRVALHAWIKTWGETRLILLDSRLGENTPQDQAICDHLYAKDIVLQLAQEMCLGFGGVSVLKALDLEPEIYHLNEGHTALAGLALVLEYRQAHPQASFEAAVEAVRPQLVGTKHTILAGAGILLDWDSVKRQLGPALEAAAHTSMEDLREVAAKDEHDYSDTKLMISLVHRASGVSKIHVAVEKHDHPNSSLIPITNGVYRGRWMAEPWGEDPLSFDDATFWRTHTENRHRLLEFVRGQTGDQLDPERLTVVWARRMASYKRPELLVHDLGRLAAFVRQADRAVQFVVAGKANPADPVGTELMQRIIAAAQHPELVANFAYLPYYNPASAKFLVRGADLWLNTPIRGYEACGTSGMKASLNGAVQFSTSDGWIDEVDAGAIGWVLPEDNAQGALYDILEHNIAPMFYDRGADGLPHVWIAKMRANMRLILDNFTTTRMLDEYYEKLYR